MRQDVVGMTAVGRALILLNQRQTPAERITKDTIQDNARGFTPYDAAMGTDMAMFFQRTGFLTQKQLAYWRKPNSAGIPRICKYWKQIQEEAMEKHNITKLKRSRKSVKSKLDQPKMI